MSILSFGSGTLVGVRTDVANATPVKFGALQDVSVEFSASIKELYGGSQFPIAVARGTGKINCKAKLGQIMGGVFSDLFFGTTMATGQLAFVHDEAGAVPAASTYIVTVANSATWVEDLGVINATTGLPMKKVASAPATGQYSVVAGVYTFAAADASVAVLISYTYTIAAAGQKLVVANQALGVQPVFSVYLKTNYTAPNGVKYSYLKLNACVSNKLTLPTKLEDFTIMELDFSAFSDNAGNILTFCTNEVS